MPSAFEIHQWPIPRFSVFLSHSAEDRERLIDPIYESLTDEGIIAWYDQRDYPDGFDPIDALQESLLSCHHVVYFITASSVNQGRGWNAAERTISSRINRAFIFSPINIHNFELPLFFVPYDHAATARSIWNPIRQHGPTCPFRINDSRAIDWAVKRIRKYLEQQYYYRTEALRIIQQEPVLASQVDRFSGLQTWLSSRTITPRLT